MSMTQLLGVLVFLFLLVAVIWRIASNRQSLPCPVWLSWMVELDNPFTKTNRAAEIIRHLDVQTGMTVLDAGCGPGRLSIPLAKAVGVEGKVVALDLQAGMLQRTRVNAELQHIDNIVYFKAGLGDGKLQGMQFDRIVLVTVLGEIPDQQSAMQELFEVLKPGGILSVTEVIFDPHFQRRSSVIKLATSIGFQEKQFFGNSIAYTLHLTKPAN